MKKNTTLTVFSVLIILTTTLACSTITGLFESMQTNDETQRSGIGERSEENEREVPPGQDDDGHDNVMEDMFEEMEEHMEEDGETERPGELRRDGEDDSHNPPPPAKGERDFPFPLPPDASNVQDIGGTTNFQTSMGIDEAVDFYRHTFQQQEMTEDKLLTVIDDTTFSMVFEGAPNGKVIVVQGVDFGDSTNINIRYEDL